MMDSASGVRTPKRSIMRPKTGDATAVMTLDTPIAVAMSPRPKPSSCAIGLINIPVAKTLMGPWLATRANEEAATIDQRLLSIFPPVRHQPVRLGLVDHRARSDY